MLEFDFAVLAALGLTPALASRAAGQPLPTDGVRSLLRVTEVHRETIVVHDGVNEVSARALPKLMRALQEEETALVVGDWVIAYHDAQGGFWLEHRVPPSSALTRRDGDGRRHPVVSNVDTALLVMGLDDDFNPRRLERYLALIHGTGVLPVVVLTKADVAAPTADALHARLNELRGRIAPDIDVLAVNATHPSAADGLRRYLEAGQTLVLLGSSGVGKSTLTNTLLGVVVQDTGPVREHDSRGKHTTTARSLHRTAGGASIIDTPGVRTLRPDGDAASIAGSFADVEALSAQCRFRDCRHEDEPGCAVRGGVPEDRLRNYHKLLREMRRDTMTALDRQRQVATYKVRSRAVREKMRVKRGA